MPPKNDTAGQAVGAAAPVITVAGAAAAPPQSLADRFPPTVLPRDEHTGVGGSYVMDADGVRTRVDEPEAAPAAADGDAADQPAA